jgi:hypothetical protein
MDGLYVRVDDDGRRQKLSTRCRDSTKNTHISPLPRPHVTVDAVSLCYVQDLRRGSALLDRLDRQARTERMIVGQRVVELEVWVWGAHLSQVEEGLPLVVEVAGLAER